MIDADKRKAVFALHQSGVGDRQIAKMLGLGRNTVRRIIALKGEMPAVNRPKKCGIDEELLRKLYDECEGWVQRVHEKLTEEHKIDIKYSTLTRRLRELKISTPPKSRCDRVADVPGAEMQHDTSPYGIKLAGRKVKLIGSLLYLRFSKRRYLKFYPFFNRFRMKCFMHEAFTYWQFAAPVCIVDNTSLVRLSGTGASAKIVPEMEADAKSYGFEYRCHELGHCDRKAGNERSFFFVETNFFPGRTFQSLEDLNAQALEWATVRIEHRPQGDAKVIPARPHAKRVRRNVRQINVC